MDHSHANELFFLMILISSSKKDGCAQYISPSLVTNPHVILLHLVGVGCCRITEAISAGALACFTGHVCVFSYVNVFMNLFVCVSVYARKRRGRERESQRERPTAAKARSPDIIEDDISDYPKDRNLSLSVIYLQLFYRPAFSRYAALNSG